MYSLLIALLTGLVSFQLSCTGSFEKPSKLKVNKSENENISFQWHTVGNYFSKVPFSIDTLLDQKVSVEKIHSLLEDIGFEEVQGDFKSENFSQNHLFVFQLDLSNDTTTSLDLFIAMPKAEVIMLDNENHSIVSKTGFLLPEDTKTGTTFSGIPGFKFTLEPKSHHSLYFLSIPGQLRGYNNLKRQGFEIFTLNYSGNPFEFEDTINKLMLGLFIAFSLFFVSLFYITKPRIYTHLYFALFGFSFMLLFANQEGYFVQYIWPNYPIWNYTYWERILAVFTFGWFSRFSRFFLDIDRNYPSIHHLLWTSVVALVLYSSGISFWQWTDTASFWHHYHHLSAGFQLVQLLVMCTILLGAGIARYYQLHSSGIFLLGTAALWVGAFSHFLQNMDFFALNFGVQLAEVGMVVQMFLFAFGVVRQYEEIRHRMHQLEKLIEAYLPKVSSGSIPSHSPYLQKVLMIIKENYMFSEFGVKKLAEALNVHPNTLRNDLKDIGKPSVIIRKFRIGFAKHLLENNWDLTIEAVSELVGYKNIQTFSRVFKLEEQISPSDYKQNYWKSTPEFNGFNIL